MTMESKDIYLKKKLAEKGIYDYPEDNFKALKKIFIDNIVYCKLDKERAFEDAFKIVFGGKNESKR